MLNAARICAVCLLAFLAMWPIACAQSDGGCADAAGMCDGGNPNDGGIPPACDGALCDTTNGASCSSAGKPDNLAWLAVVAAACALPTLRRRHQRLGGADRHD